MDSNAFRDLLQMGGVPAARPTPPPAGPYMNFGTPGARPVPVHRTELDRIEDERQRLEADREAIRRQGWTLPT